jgi:L-alanine-DL-glutamate epimerase-like enolase superfamily enzyme
VLAVLDSIEGLVVGESPYDIERISKRIDVVGTWHHVRATSPAIAAVEMACWDLVGKAAGLPLVNLFGGRVRDRVECFYYLPRAGPDEVRAAAATAVGLGFSTGYLKVGWGELAADRELVEAARDGGGDAFKLRVDANESWSAGAAVRAVRELEQFDLELVEQPVSGRNLDAMAYVRGRVGVPVLANEATWTRYDILACIRHEAADAISVDNQMDGGLLNLKRAAGICEAAALPVVKHSLGELAIATYAAAHVIASTPNFLYANQSYAALLADDVIAGGAPEYYNGGLSVPEHPGIGVELDPDRVERYAALYRDQPEDFTFRDAAALQSTPLMPKR